MTHDNGAFAPLFFVGGIGSCDRGGDDMRRPHGWWRNPEVYEDIATGEVHDLARKYGLTLNYVWVLKKRIAAERPDGPPGEGCPERVRALRRRAGLTQAEFGALINRSWQQISKWERGLAQCDEALIELAERKIAEKK